MNRHVFALAFSLCAASAAAQQPLPPSTPSQPADMLLTLAEAEQRALDRNPAIASARLGAQAASYSVAESRAAYSPSFSATLAQRSQTNPSTTQLSGGQEQVTTDALTFGSGISQALPWGGGNVSIGFNAIATRRRTSSRPTTRATRRG